MAATYSVDGQSFGSIGEVEDYLSGQGYDKYTIEDNRQGGIGRQTGVGMGEGAGLLGAAGGGGRGFTSLGDMFDGGGPGRSGSTFVGGPYSAGLNAVGVRPAGYTERMAAASGPQGQRGFNGYGYTDPKTGQWVSAGRDMIDGGGPGRSGDKFQGGPFSGLLNTLGVRPAGYRDRLEDNLAPQTSLRPQMRPAGLLGGTAGTQSAVDRALSAASAGDTSAAQSFSGMPYQIGITPPAAVAPSVMSGSPVAPPSPALFAGFSNYGAGQSLRYEPDMGRRYYGYIQDPAGAIDRPPSVDTSYYDPTGGRYQPTWLNERTGVSPLNLEPQPRRGFGDYMADIYGPIFGR